MEIGLRHLACFVAVAQERTLARAAQRLHVSQPAVSKTLAELERMAGRRLVVRGRSGTALTLAGEQFLRHATEATRAVDAASAALLTPEAPRPPVLAMGALHTVTGILAKGIAALTARRPDIRVTVRVAHNPELLTLLKAGEVDLAVGRMAEPAMMRGISFELLYAEHLAVVVRPGHPLRAPAGGSPSPRDLLAYPLVIPEEGTAPRMAAEAVFEAAGARLAPGHTETQSASLARSLALESDAVWITPRHAVHPDLDNGWLAALDVPVPAAAEPVGLLTRSTRQPAAGEARASEPGELAAELMGILRALA